MCVVKSAARAKDLPVPPDEERGADMLAKHADAPHSLHLNGRTPECVAMWRRRLLRNVKDLPHVGHAY